MTTPAVVHFDGGARPPSNGSAAIGYTIETDDWYHEDSNPIGKATNNEAEYQALIRGLETALQKDCTDVDVRGDSRLIVNQVNGDWKTNEQHLRRFRDRAQELAEEFTTFEITWVDRGENLRADELVDREFPD